MLSPSLSNHQSQHASDSFFSLSGLLVCTFIRAPQSKSPPHQFYGWGHSTFTTTCDHWIKNERVHEENNETQRMRSVPEESKMMVHNRKEMTRSLYVLLLPPFDSLVMRLINRLPTSYKTGRGIWKYLNGICTQRERRGRHRGTCTQCHSVCRHSVYTGLHWAPLPCYLTLFTSFRYRHRFWVPRTKNVEILGQVIVL